MGLCLSLRLQYKRVVNCAKVAEEIAELGDVIVLRIISICVPIRDKK